MASSATVLNSATSQNMSVYTSSFTISCSTLPRDACCSHGINILFNFSGNQTSSASSLTNDSNSASLHKIQYIDGQTQWLCNDALLLSLVKEEALEVWFPEKLNKMFIPWEQQASRGSVEHEIVKEEV